MLAGITIELDGVLIESASLQRASLTAAFAAEHLHVALEHTPLDPSASFDDLVTDVITAHPTDGPLAALDATVIAIIAARAAREFGSRVSAGVTLVDGARDVIAALASEYRVAVVTGWRRADAERVLALAELDGVVRFVTAADDGPGFAPARGRYVRALSRLRHAGAEGSVAALVAGPRGVDAAQGAGARAIFVGVNVLIADLTPARLTAMTADPVPPAAMPVVSPPSRP